MACADDVFQDDEELSTEEITSQDDEEFSAEEITSEDDEEFSAEEITSEDDEEDDEELPVETRFQDALMNDNKEEFLSMIKENKCLFEGRGQELLEEACFSGSFRCALALLEGETSLIANINGCEIMFPIHYGAKYVNPSTTEFALYYGARTDVRCGCRVPGRGHVLPLCLPLYEISSDKVIKEHTTKDSVFKLLTLLCLSQFRYPLETVGLLAWNTKETNIEEEILQYARENQLAHIAALLVAAHKRFSDSIETVFKWVSIIDSDATIGQNMKEAVRLLFEVFLNAGDAIEAYVKLDRFGVTMQQMSEDVACLLQEAGFAVKFADTDLTRCGWFRVGDYKMKNYRMLPDKDRDMPHYGKSGYRWMANCCTNEPRRLLGKKVVDRQKIALKEEVLYKKKRLDKALINDDKEAFLSIIHLDNDLFQLKGQEIIEKACEYRAFRCAATLVKGETPLVVGINGRTDDKMFPIHHAAKTCHPSITELLLYYGASADTRADICCVWKPPCAMAVGPPPRRRLRLPLYRTLHEMCCNNAFCCWDATFYPFDSIFSLLSAICLPRFQNHLETVELLAQYTSDKEIEREFLQCARDGELVHMTALLLVARKRLSDPVETLFSSLKSFDKKPKIRKYKQEAMLLLLETLVMAGDAIEKYVKQGKVGVTIHQTCKDVACLLQEAGFAIKHWDVDLTRIFWTSNEREWRSKPEDIGMPHYGETGCRWTAFGKPSRPLMIPGKKDKDQQRFGAKHFHSQAGVDVEVTSRVVPCSGLLAKAVGKVVDKVSCRGSWKLLAFARRGFLKHIFIK